MAVKMVGKCKNCGAEIKVNDDQERAFCQYCGAEFTIEEDSGTLAHEMFSYLNKAGKRRQEEIKLKAEYAEKDAERRHESAKKAWKYLIILMAVWLAVLILASVFNL